MNLVNRMEKTIGAFEARRNFGQLLQEVAVKGDKIVVERHGEPIAVVVPVELYNQWKRERQRFFDQMREVSQRVNLDEDEAMQLALEAQQAVRAAARASTESL
jgi:prevent-host-death family protein